MILVLAYSYIAGLYFLFHTVLEQLVAWMTRSMVVTLKVEIVHLLENRAREQIHKSFASLLLASHSVVDLAVWHIAVVGRTGSNSLHHFHQPAVGSYSGIVLAVEGSLADNSARSLFPDHKRNLGPHAFPVGERLDILDTAHRNLGEICR